MGAHTTARHIACIMDGNGRWAQQRGLPRAHGHKAAVSAVDTVIRTALEEGIPWLTLFAFSTENWSRPQEEIDTLMDTSCQFLRRRVHDWHRAGIRLRRLGEETPRISEDLRQELQYAHQLTQDNSTMTLTVAANHGGRGEIVRAARTLVEQQVPAEDVTEESFAQHLQNPDMPDVDLVIRTSGGYRLSNFALWRCAYAEFVFPEVLWPDFRAEHFRQALELYAQRRRRFGGATTSIPHPRSPQPQPPFGLADSLPSLSSVLSLPGGIASRLGGHLLAGLYDTARYAKSQLETRNEPPL
ncbi:polyprenyl diphosphate synthase [Streptomyces halobius]|uniref:Isoprenyl transferase n=1 Tax=Streptomyces halobius TaxID=2879846 RepID=A0ABY4M2T3_9ACTN|nr:polyprenyl diphosphate synthase [Streptomyces halobius]UQA90655.1 di-trans,poly-cis-decaprenylcistransferase [Streptomyces halobius]